MNLTRIIEETGRHIRAGKMPAEKITNADVKQVLETAVDVMKQALFEDERIEIQGFVVIELKRTAVKPSALNGKMRKEERLRWVIKPSKTMAQRIPNSPKLLR
jgi:nucleoid DNA-binding protein